MNYNFLLTEFGILSLFLICLLYVIKHDKKYVSLLIFAIIYAIIFENGNILLSQNKTGGYYYNDNFMFFIYDLPLFVALAWAIIIYTSKRIADSLPIKEFSKLFAASLLVLLIDLAIDVVAIRLGYWTWIGYSFTDGFFGVPADNFIGWLLVSFTFFLLNDLVVKDKFFGKENLFKHFLTTLLSYFIFLVFFIPISSLESALQLSKSQEFYILLVLIAIFLLNIKIDSKKSVVPRNTLKMSYLVRAPFYIFGLIAIIANRIYLENVLLLIFSLFFILIEIFLMKFEKV